MDGRYLRALVAVGYGLTSASGLILYAILALALFRDRRKYVGNGFYRVVLHLGVADTGLLLVTLSIVVPLTIAGYDIIPEFWQTQTLRLALLCWYSLFFSTFLMAFGRFAVFVTPNFYRSLFEGENNHLSGIITWLLAVFHTLGRELLTCSPSYDFDDFHLTTKHCSKNLSSAGVVFLDYAAGLNKYGPFVMLAFYLATVLYISWHFKRSMVNTSFKREVTIMIQGFLICGICLANTWSYWFLMQITENAWTHVLGTLFLFFNSMINPIIYFIFNSQVRRSVRKLFGFKTNTSRVTPRLAMTGSSKVVFR